jgi:hypothetical protein
MNGMVIGEAIPTYRMIVNDWRDMSAKVLYHAALSSPTPRSAVPPAPDCKT